MAPAVVVTAPVVVTGLVVRVDVMTSTPGRSASREPRMKSALVVKAATWETVVPAKPWPSLTSTLPSARLARRKRTTKLQPLQEKNMGTPKPRVDCIASICLSGRIVLESMVPNTGA